MNRFSDYFSNYISADINALIGNGEISDFTVSRSSRTLTVGFYLDSFIDYQTVKSAEKSISDFKIQFFRSGISRVLNGITKQYKGFIFEYAQ